jgi:hypothetical protein
VVFYGNIVFSGMSTLGALSSSISLLFIIYAFYFNDKKYILLFFIWCWFLGPNSFINFHEYGYHTIGRIDYFFSVLLILNYVIVHKKINIWFLLIITFFSVSVCLNSFGEHDFENKIDIYYQSVSSILCAYLLFLLIKNSVTEGARKQSCVFYFLFLIFFLNVILAYFNIFFPDINIRSEAVAAKQNLFGFHLNRPSGFFSSAFRFSLSTLFLALLIYSFIDDSKKKTFIIFNLFFVFPLVFLSSFAVFLGVMLYFINLYLNRFMFFKKVLFFSFCFLILYIFLFHFSLSDLGKSSGTKMLMWRMIFDDILYNSTFFEMFFGHGAGSAKIVSQEIPLFISSYEHGVISYDHEILARDGFLLTHNIFIQTLYEYGVLLFIVIAFPTIRSLFYIFFEKKFSFLNMFFMAAFLNYILHNGIFSVYYFSSLLLVNYIFKNNGRIFKERFF